MAQPSESIELLRATYAENLRLRELLAVVAQDLERIACQERYAAHERSGTYRCRARWCLMRHLLVVAALLVALPAGAVTIDWVPIGNAGNAPDTATNCLNDAADCGSVPYAYYISKYEVTNAQYAEFLNAVAASDSFSLYNEDMGPTQCLECTPRLDSIRRSGSSGSYTYTATPGSENKPVFYVSFWDAVRFANWLNNGQGSSDTETGAYTITAAGVENNTITRNEEATVVLPTENEWYKAAYYSPGGVYYDYPTGTDAETACVAPKADTGNSANCDTSSTYRELTDVGAYGLSVSPYGTFDQGGNVWEWNEQIAPADIGGGSGRGVRGGTLGSFGGASNLTASTTAAFDPTIESVGFRVAALVPEPAQAFLALTGGLVLAAARRQRRA